ncbi:MAG: ABC transporter permease [Myxococcales bacterium]|nr:ABC transporter permease [Myxococcales bacterium]
MRFLTLVAWRNLWRHKRRSLITAGAMAVAVGVSMGMICFQEGMFDTLFDVMVEQQLGHVQVHHPDYPGQRTLHDTLDDADALVNRIEEQPGTASVSPRINGFALVGGEKKSAGAMLVGVDAARMAKTTRVLEQIEEGSFLSVEGAGEIVVGHKLLEELEIGVGESVVAVTQSADGSMGNALYEIVGTYKTGNAQLDRSGAFLHLGDVQDLLVLPDQVHQLTVLSSESDDIEGYAAGLSQTVSSDVVQVQTWQEASPQTAQLMAMRDFAAFFILGIVLLTAAFGIVNTMLMSVFERTRELGVLRALGIRRGRMMSLIVVESIFLAAVASALGLALGGAFSYYLVTYGYDMSASLEDGFSFSGVTLDPVIYGALSPRHVVNVVIAVFGVSILASLWPAWRAANLRPVEAIRSE